MRRFLLQNPYGLGLVIATAMLNLAWPVLGHVRAAAPAMPLMEICTAQGLQAATGGEAPAGDTDQHAWQQHCPLCPLGADRPALANSVPGIHAALVSQGPPPAHRPVAAWHEEARSPAQPRAPPAIA